MEKKEARPHGINKGVCVKQGRRTRATVPVGGTRVTAARGHGTRRKNDPMLYGNLRKLIKYIQIMLPLYVQLRKNEEMRANDSSHCHKKP